MSGAGRIRSPSIAHSPFPTPELGGVSLLPPGWIWSHHPSAASLGGCRGAKPELPSLHPTRAQGTQGRAGQGPGSKSNYLLTNKLTKLTRLPSLLGSFGGRIPAHLEKKATPEVRDPGLSQPEPKPSAPSGHV